LRISNRLVRSENSLRKICSSSSSYCKNEDHPDPTKTAEPQQPDNKNPKLKLSQLIQSMSKEKDSKAPATSSVFVIPKVSKQRRKSKKAQSKPAIEPEMLEAVDKVTELFPETKEDTRNSLIEKLEAVENETELQSTIQDPVKETNQVSNLTSAESPNVDEAEQVAEPLKVEPKVKPVIKTQGPSVAKINSLLSQFKVDPELVKDNRNRFNSRTSFDSPRGSLFDGTPLKIFEGVEFESSKTAGRMTMWTKLNERELQLSVASPPTNGYEQMILWTQQGKLWQFPINNEQGLEEEARVGFHEHIFLEPYLNPWCPKRGPIRHFMELVCTGLSKNPYLSVSQKKEHINWFRNYFSAKRSILIETGAVVESASNQLTV